MYGLRPDAIAETLLEIKVPVLHNGSSRDPIYHAVRSCRVSLLALTGVQNLTREQSTVLTNKPERRVEPGILPEAQWGTDGLERSLFD